MQFSVTSALCRVCVFLTSGEPQWFVTTPVKNHYCRRRFCIRTPAHAVHGNLKGLKSSQSSRLDR